MTNSGSKSLETVCTSKGMGLASLLGPHTTNHSRKGYKGKGGKRTELGFGQPGYQGVFILPNKKGFWGMGHTGQL